MADEANRLFAELSRLVGELQGGFREVKDLLRRQDEVSIVRDQQAEINKRLAIEARERDKAEITEHQNQLHAENKKEFDEIKEKASRTFGMAAAADEWTKKEGAKLIEDVQSLGARVTAIENGGKIKAAESRGKKIAYGTVGAVLGAVGLSALSVLVPDAIGALKKFLHIG